MKTIKTHLIILVLLSFFSCKKMDECHPATVTPPPPVTTTTEEIQLINTAFSPADKTISVGTKIKWVNKDPYAHTVTSSTNIFDSGNMNEGQVFEYTFNTAGVFEYYCKYHLPGMTGKITVQ
jgi:plastocyanin